MKPSWRICTHKFRQDGILLPFGHPRNQYTVPNPKFFQAADEWPMKDSADPLEGWPLSEVLSVHTGLRDDVNGKLYQYIHSCLVEFHGRLQALEIKFRLYQGDVRQAVPQLMDTKTKYDRIEVSNICDRGYLGIKEALALFGPRLCPRQSNPHATLITLFLNAVEQSFSPMDRYQDLMETMKKLSQYLPLTTSPNANPNDAESLRFSAAGTLVRDVDKYFDRYMKFEDFHGAGEAAGVRMKPKNTVVA